VNPGLTNRIKASPQNADVKFGIGARGISCRAKSLPHLANHEIFERDGREADAGMERIGEGPSTLPSASSLLLAAVSADPVCIEANSA
jgi:hypothetical protein